MHHLQRALQRKVLRRASHSNPPNFVRKNEKLDLKAEMSGQPTRVSDFLTPHPNFFGGSLMFLNVYQRKNRGISLFIHVSHPIFVGFSPQTGPFLPVSFNSLATRQLVFSEATRSTSSTQRRLEKRFVVDLATLIYFKVGSQDPILNWEC